MLTFQKMLFDWKESNSKRNWTPPVKVWLNPFGWRNRKKPPWLDGGSCARSWFGEATIAGGDWWRLAAQVPLSPPVQHSSVPGKQGGAGHATLIHNVLLSYFQAVVWTRPLVCMAVHVRLLAPSLAHLHQMFKPFHSRRSGPGSTGEMRSLRWGGGFSGRKNFGKVIDVRDIRSKM